MANEQCATCHLSLAEARGLSREARSPASRCLRRTGQRDLPGGHGRTGPVRGRDGSLHGGPELRHLPRTELLRQLSRQCPGDLRRSGHWHRTSVPWCIASPSPRLLHIRPRTSWRHTVAKRSRKAGELRQLPHPAELYHLPRRGFDSEAGVRDAPAGSRAARRARSSAPPARLPCRRLPGRARSRGKRRTQVLRHLPHASPTASPATGSSRPGRPGAVITIRPASWSGTRRSAYARQTTCADCHNAQQFCLSCHAQAGLSASRTLGSSSFHDGRAAFIVGHGQAARQSLESCVSCHVERDCMACHSSVGRGFRFNPHGPGFDAEPAAAAESRDVHRVSRLGHSGSSLKGSSLLIPPRLTARPPNCSRYLRSLAHQRPGVMTELNRRAFLKSAAVASAASAAAPLSPPSRSRLPVHAPKATRPIPGGTRPPVIFAGWAADCSSRCRTAGRSRREAIPTRRRVKALVRQGLPRRPDALWSRSDHPRDGPAPGASWSRFRLPRRWIWSAAGAARNPDAARARRRRRLRIGAGRSRTPTSPRSCSRARSEPTTSRPVRACMREAPGPASRAASASTAPSAATKTSTTPTSSCSGTSISPRPIRCSSPGCWPGSEATPPCASSTSRTRTTRTSYPADESLLHLPHVGAGHRQRDLPGDRGSALGQAGFRRPARRIQARKDRRSAPRSPMAPWWRRSPGRHAGTTTWHSWRTIRPSGSQAMSGLSAARLRWLASLYGDRSRKVMSVWGANVNGRTFAAPG